MNMFSFLAGPLGFIMQMLYRLLGNYGWTIILFTLLVRVIMFPLSLKQQKSTARQQAYQPMIQEIQKKWATDKNRMNQEMMKFQEENGIKMTAGCAPTIATFLVMFGIIAVIQAPLGYMLSVPADQISNGVAIVRQLDENSEIAMTEFTQQSVLIGEVRAKPDTFKNGVDVVYSGEKQVVLKDGHLAVVDGKITVVSGNYEIRDNRLYTTGQQEASSSSASSASGASQPEEGSASKHPSGFEGELNFKHISMEAERVDSINTFKFDFFGINLAQYPKWNFDRYLIMPILSILTMFGSQIIIMKTGATPGQGKGTMLIMTLVMGVMFGYYAFTVPVGFSLYYTASNVIMTVQQLVVRRIHNPETIKEQIMIELEERKKAKKAKKKLIVQDESGVDVAKELNEAEYAKHRLEMARKLDAERYGSDTVSSAAPAEKVQKSSPSQPDVDNAPQDQAAEQSEESAHPDTAKENKTESKPGRRRRASLNKDKADQNEAPSFAQTEQADEEKSE